MTVQVGFLEENMRDLPPGELAGYVPELGLARDGENDGVSAWFEPVSAFTGGVDDLGGLEPAREIAAGDDVVVGRRTRGLAASS